MRITILNGNPAVANTCSDVYLGRLRDILAEAGHAIQVLVLRELEITRVRQGFHRVASGVLWAC